MKKFLAVILCLCMVLTMAGCGSKESSMETTAPAEQMNVTKNETTSSTDEEKNVKNSISVERYTEWIESQTAPWDGYQYRGMVRDVETGEDANGMKYELYPGRWSYECDGKKGTDVGDDVWAELYIYPDLDFQGMLAMATEGVSEELLAASNFVQGDNWFMGEIGLTLGNGVMICVDNCILRVYSTYAGNDYAYTVIEEIVG